MLTLRLGRVVGLGCGVLLMLLAALPAAAASAAVSGLTASVGLLAALGALLATHGVPDGSGEAVAWATGGVALISVGWAWREVGHSILGALGIRRDPSRVVDAVAVDPAPLPLTDAASGGSALCGRPVGALPDRFDQAEVLAAARQRFVGLQAAWDAGDVDTLRTLTTPDMLDELLDQLPARGQAPNRTDVLKLDAALLGIDGLGAVYLASVEFSGVIRESAEQGAVPFRELWMLACPKDQASGWRLACQQALL